MIEIAPVSPQCAGQVLAHVEATQVETYVRGDDADLHDFAGVDPTAAAAGDRDSSQLMMFRIETFPVGTQLHTWLQLSRPSDLEWSFFMDVLDAFCKHPRVGGRTAVGHGHVSVDLVADTAAPVDLMDWRAHLMEHRDDAITLLRGLR